MTTAEALARVAEAKVKLESEGWTPEVAEGFLKAFSTAQAQAVAVRVRAMLQREFPRLGLGRLDLWDATAARWLQINWAEGKDPTVAWLPVNPTQ
jgi:hypothetical protein